MRVPHVEVLARPYPKTPEKGRTGNKGEYKIQTEPLQSLSGLR